MGMSASQGRLLTLTARLSDLEFSAQSISNSKIRLATQSEEIAKNYADALDKKKLMVSTGFNSETNTRTYSQATVAMLTGFNTVSSLEAQRLLKDSNGRVAVSSAFAAAYSASTDLTGFLGLAGVDANSDDAVVNYFTRLYNEVANNGATVIDDAQGNSSDWLYEQLQNGNLYLEKWDSKGGEDGAGKFDSISWSSGDSILREDTDNTDMAIAEAKYQSEMAGINSKDKRFDLELKNIDTEHNAIQTEVDSVKKVLDKNIERSFKIFNG